ncbi:hypothetical protein [Helicobacter gastrocanis]|uniref:hypothetical protein n=1 Tax=Helicobacter gastrocanis TaxID=2849641 RepID=UPI001C84833A|nr:hypothetical protein [Helicobacter sp. NHP19-003]
MPKIPKPAAGFAISGALSLREKNTKARNKPLAHICLWFSKTSYNGPSNPN